MGDLPTVVLVDDAAEVRELVRTWLDLDGGLTVVDEASNGAEAVERAEQHQPTVMLLDVSMPVMDGLEALPLVLAASPETKVVLYSGFEEQGLADKALGLGASAFLKKSAPIEELSDMLLALAGVDPSRPVTPPAPARGSARPSSPDQELLDEHSERFREVFEAAAIGMATLTLSGNIVRTNAAMAHLLHSRTEDLVGTFYGDLTGDQGDEVRTLLEKMRERALDVGHLEHEVTGLSRRVVVLATIAPVRDSAGRPLYHFLQLEDVTTERLAVEQLRTSEERFRMLVEAVEDYAIFMLDPEGLVVSWNAGAQRNKGYTADEVIGRHFRIFYPPEVAASGHPEHELAMALQHGHYEEEGWRIRKDGSRFWANVVITAVHDPSGAHVGFAKVTRDTSERRRLEDEREDAVDALGSANAELAVLNRRLKQASEDQAQFLAVTAHELRTPVGVLKGSAHLLTQYHSRMSDEDRAQTFASMENATTRLTRLVDDLLTASRIEHGKLAMKTERVAVADVVVGAVDTVKRSHPDSAIEVTDVPAAYVLGDRDRLSQAVENLVANALRHGAPPVEVATSVEDGQVLIRVSDHGPGISAAMRGRLFERFATGLQRGGTGLGLFIVRELARAHGGDARYDPPATDGARGAFVLCLPPEPTVQATPPLTAVDR